MNTNFWKVGDPATDPRLRSEFSDYIVNSVGNFDGTPKGFSGYQSGGGLAETHYDSPGCRGNRIPMPSKFCVLVDRWDKGTNHRKYFAGPTDLAKYGQVVDMFGSPFVMNFYSHSNGGNYLFSDGHAEWKNWKTITFAMFRLSPAGYDNWNLTP